MPENVNTFSNLILLCQRHFLCQKSNLLRTKARRLRSYYPSDVFPEPLIYNEMSRHHGLLIDQWLRHYTCSGFCKTTYHLLISPPSTNLPNTLKFILERIKLTARVECGASIHAIFQLTVRRIQMFFSLKPSQSQGESSLKISARWGSPFRRSQGTSKQTHSLTDRLVL